MGCSKGTCPSITLVLTALLDQLSQYDPPLGPAPMQTTTHSYPPLPHGTSCQDGRASFLILLSCTKNS